MKANGALKGTLLGFLSLLMVACGPDRERFQAQPPDFNLPTINSFALDSGDVQDQAPKQYFDSYILKAVKFLYEKYRMLGYDMNSLYTHELPYGRYGFVKGTPGPKTMCVAAQLEIILTAMDIYSKETGDRTLYDFLPEKSWVGLSPSDIKGYIWVNSHYGSFGTADALKHFGMGEVTTFEKLKPGAFINFSRNNRTGHAVTFISYIDSKGQEFDSYNSNIIGFKYFSAQGKKDPATAGLDYRYAVFSKFGCPDMPYKKDCEVIYSTSRSTLDSGRMWAPQSWKHLRNTAILEESGRDSTEITYDSEFYNGDAVDDSE